MSETTRNGLIRFLVLETLSRGGLREHDAPCDSATCIFGPPNAPTEDECRCFDHLVARHGSRPLALLLGRSLHHLAGRVIDLETQLRRRGTRKGKR